MTEDLPTPHGCPSRRGRGGARIPRPWALAALLDLAVLAGCATFTDEPIEPRETAQSFEQRTLGDAGLRDFLARHAPDETWQKGSWSLETLTLVALYYQPDLDVARSEHEIELAALGAAAERPNPALTWTPAYNTSSSEPSPWILGFALDVPIETSGKRGYREDRARGLAEAARYAIASKAWEVRARLRSALVILQSSRERMALLKEQVELQEETARLLEAQLGAGAVSPQELTTARIALDRARLELGDADREVGDATQQVAQALGIPAGALEGADIRFDEFRRTPEVPPLAARRQALLNRPDLLGSLAEYAASQSALQLEVARQFPDLHLGPGYELDQGESKWSLGLALELPVLNRNQGAIGVAEAAREAAAARFTALQAKVIGEVERAAAAYEAALERVGSVDGLRTRLQAQEAVARATTELGETDRLSLLGARLELVSNSLERLDSMSRAQDALGLLEDSMRSPAALPESLWAAVPERRSD